MRKLLISLVVAATITPGSSQAQVTLDMSRITCADYVAYVGIPGSHLFRMDERLVQSQMGLHDDGPR